MHSSRFIRRHSLVCAAAAAVVAAMAGHAQAQIQGPSTLQTPYVVPVAPGVITKSIASNGNGLVGGTPDELHPRIGGGNYRLVGIPDGLGARPLAQLPAGVEDPNPAPGKGYFELYMNHELGPTAGIVRAHGQAGSFVSRWVIDTNLNVLGGADLITQVQSWNVASNSFANTTGISVFDRFCSADLPATTAFFNPGSGLGTQERLFVHGEETRPTFSPIHGQAWATPVTGASAGTTYELPRLGDISWENLLPSPLAQDKTIVMNMDDSSAATGLPGPFTAATDVPSELYMYVGTKTNSGNVVERAGLNNGGLFGVVLNEFGASTTVVTHETRAFGLATGGAFANKADFTLHNFGNVSNDVDGLQLQNDSKTNNVAQFARLEDGVWNTAAGKENEFYFLTTDNLTSSSGRSRLFRMTFADMANPENGGVMDMLLDGTEGGEMYDNMTLAVGADGKARLLLQEDPGGNNRSARIWLYEPDSDALLEIAKHDVARFGETPSPAAVLPFNNNEESSGIIPAFDILGPGWFLADVQAHYGIGGELVEGGQLFAMYVPQAVPEPGALGLGLLGLSALAGRRRRVR